jgi:hypothetical protein
LFEARICEATGLTERKGSAQALTRRDMTVEESFGIRAVKSCREERKTAGNAQPLQIDPAGRPTVRHDRFFHIFQIWQLTRYRRIEEVHQDCVETQQVRNVHGEQTERLLV